MKKIILAGFVAMTIASTTFAGGICENFAGHWTGSFTLKSQSDCDLYGGCTHALQADITRLSETLFQVDLQPTKGEGGVFNMTCENGVLNSPVNPGNTINASCDENNHCVAYYDDPRLTAKGEK